MDFGEICFRFYEQQSNGVTICYHIVRLAMPIRFVPQLPLAARNTYCITVMEASAILTPTELASAMDLGLLTHAGGFSQLTDVVCLAAVYQMQAFPACHQSSLATEATARHIDFHGPTSQATFPPGTSLNGMLMPPNQILRMALLLESALPEDSASRTSTEDGRGTDSNGATEDCHSELPTTPVSPSSFTCAPNSPSWPQI